MTPRQLWAIAYRFKRSIKHSRWDGWRGSINGVYPTWMPQYRDFLHMCRLSEEVTYPRRDKLADKEWLERRIKDAQERLTWCEQTTQEDVLRSIHNAMVDQYILGGGAR